jgi:hypothetical protein
MEIGSPYATAIEYAEAHGKDDTSDLDVVEVDLKAISRFMEKRLGRFFNKDAAAVTRVFDPPASSSELLLNCDLVSVTSIKIDTDGDGVFTDALAATDYVLLPRNAADGPEPEPYRRVHLTAGTFTPGQAVEISGVWGWPAVPEPIKRACVHLTAMLRLEGGRGETTVSDIGQIVSANPRAIGLVDDLARHYTIPTL